MAFTALGDNLQRVREEIARVQANEGVNANARIVAVTKGHTVKAVEAAAGADPAQDSTFRTDPPLKAVYLDTDGSILRYGWAAVLV